MPKECTNTGQFEAAELPPVTWHDELLGRGHISKKQHEVISNLLAAGFDVKCEWGPVEIIPELLRKPKHFRTIISVSLELNSNKSGSVDIITKPHSLF